MLNSSDVYGNPSANPSGKGSGNPYSERRATPAPTPTPPLSGLGLGTSLRAHDTLSAAALTLVTLRPDWREQAVRDVLAADPRPWRTVIAAALTCALDPRIEHPSAITTRNPSRSSEPTPVPPPITEVRVPLRTCDHGGVEGRCPMCRTTWRTEVVA